MGWQRDGIAWERHFLQGMRWRVTLVGMAAGTVTVAAMRTAIDVHRRQTPEEASGPSRSTRQSTLGLLDPELRWLRACVELLEQAENGSLPLDHRIVSLSAFSRKLDSFFSVAVAALRDREADQRQIGRPTVHALQFAADRRQIHAHVTGLIARQYGCWKHSIVPELSQRNVQPLSHSNLNETEHQEIDRFFCETVFPILTPMAIDASHPKPAFRNKSLYIGARLRRRAGVGPNRLFGVVEVPFQVPRFVPLSGGGPRRVVLLEEVIGDRLNRLFGGYEVANWTTFRFTRDSGLRKLWREGGGDARQIQARRSSMWQADVVRLEIANGVSRPLLRKLARVEALSLTAGDSDEYSAVYLIPGPVDLGSLMEQAKVAYRLTR